VEVSCAPSKILPWKGSSLIEAEIKKKIRVLSGKMGGNALNVREQLNQSGKVTGRKGQESGQENAIGPLDRHRKSTWQGKGEEQGRKRV